MNNSEEYKASTGSDLKEKLHAGLDQLGQGIEAKKQKLADAMDRGSDKLLSGAVALEDHAANTADKLANGARYLRETTGQGVLRDCGSIVQKYPYHAVAAAAAVGLFLGRSIWKGGHSR